MTELKFHTDTSPFYENGKLIHEPEESLEAFMRRYEKACDEYQKGRRRMLEAARPHTVWRWIGNTEPRFIEDSSRNYGHRTWANAAWSDITLALATDFSSPGEITTRKAAGDKYLSYPLSRNLKRLVTYDLDGIREARGIVRMIREHSCFKKEGIRLNIAGNGLVTLVKSGLDTRAVASFITLILSL